MQTTPQTQSEQKTAKSESFVSAILTACFDSVPSVFVINRHADQVSQSIYI